METFPWTEMLGGLAFFFFGLQTIRNALQLVAGGRIKNVLRKMTGNRFTALFSGVFVTMILQSSSATTVLLVTLAGTQLLTLSQAFGVILGADIGTTFVVILLSIKKITEYALVVVALGFIVRSFAKIQKTKHIGSVILGFGLVFFGMHLMAVATHPLRNSQMAMDLFSYLAQHHFINLLVATIFTAIIQASAATIGMAISLAFAGLISFEAAIPIVLGANLGTCITAFLGSFGMGTEGKRVATAHTLIKLAGVVAAFPFIDKIAYGINSFFDHFATMIPGLEPGVAGKIAFSHLLFNIAIALFFLPFISLGVKLVKKLIPEPKDAPEPFAPRHLDENLLETPLLAFAQAKREIIRIANYTDSLIKDCLTIFENRPDIPEIIEDIQVRDDKVDILDKAVRFYLAKISREALSDEQSKGQSSLLNITNNLEEIGDIISKDMVMLAKKKYEKHSRFSDEGWKELREFHGMVLANFNLLISAISAPYPELIQKIIRHQELVYEKEDQFRQAHISRLHAGTPATFETSSIHLDLLGNLRRINGQLTYIARVLSEEI